MADFTSGRGRSGRLIPALAVTGVLTYFLEPEKGARRRADASRRVSALLGRSKETVADTARKAQAQPPTGTDSGASPAPSSTSPSPSPPSPSRPPSSSSSEVDATPLPPEVDDAKIRARERSALSGGGSSDSASS